MQKSVSLRAINTLAIPAIFAGIVEPLISISDTVIAGHLTNSEISLGAVGLVSAFISALVWIFAQTKSAISAFISQAVGANKVRDSYGLFQQLFITNFLISIVLVAVTYYFASSIFEFQNAKGKLLEEATLFFKIRVFGFPFTLLTFTIFGFFRGLQNTIWAMYISLIGGTLNIVLNYYLAVYLEFGIAGIGYASIIAQFTMFVLALFFLFYKTDFRFRIQQKLHDNYIPLLQMSGNLFIRATTLNFTFWLANYYATALGEVTLAAHTALVQIWLFSAFFLDGYSNAANAIAGKLYGEKSMQKIKQLSIQLTKIMLLISGIIIVIYIVFYPLIGSIFTKNEEIIMVFNTYFWIVIIMQPINAIAFLYDGIFKGLAKAALLRNVLLIGTFIGFIPTLFILNKFNLGMYAIWFALLVWMLWRSVPLVIQLHRKTPEQL